MKNKSPNNQKKGETESLVSSSFAYSIASMFITDSELYKNKCKELEDKLAYYKQHSIY